MPVRPAPSLLPPMGLDRVRELLRLRGVGVAAERLREAAVAGYVPAQRQGHRWVVDEDDLDVIAAYFRDRPALSHRQGAAARARAGKR
jgi:mono/diheme cytochrome c family protein